MRVVGGINAQSIVAALIGRGIPARARYREILGAIYGLTLNGLGEVSIPVPEDRLEEARAVLQAGEHGQLLLSENEVVEEKD